MLARAAVAEFGKRASPARAVARVANHFAEGTFGAGAAAARHVEPRGLDYGFGRVSILPEAQGPTAEPRSFPPGRVHLQRKLAIGEANDEYEQEADRVAAQVMRMPAPRAAMGAGPSAGLGLAEAPPIVQEVLQSPGQPLDPATRAEMESRFGHDFSRVRVHTDARAAASARVVNALAYTVGRDVVFGEGRVGEDGLLAHELVHVVQQGRGPKGPPAASRQRTRWPNRYAEYGHAEGPAVRLQRQVTRAFTEEQFEPVREAFEENVRQGATLSCILIVRKGLRLLFAAQLKGRLLALQMDQLMTQLATLHLADRPIEIEFLDARGRPTRGTVAPDSLSRSAEAAVLGAVGPETGWYLFGLSIMDGYHSVLLAVDYRNPRQPRIYWMDQIYSGFDEVTNTLDARVVQKTKDWWNGKLAEGKRYRTVLRIYPIVERLLGDFAVPPQPPGQLPA
jgi:hypothetical protein